MYRVSARQILVIAFASALLAAGTVLGVQQLSNRWQPLGAAVASAPPNANITDPTLATDEQNNIDIYKASRDATVNITSTVYRENWFFQVVPEKGTGSGFILTPNGEILTNNHVISGGSARLTVTLADKKEYKAKVLWNDPRNDLAMVKIDAGRKLPFLKLGESDNLVMFRQREVHRGE